MFQSMRIGVIGYLAAAGLATNLALVGRGLVRSVRLAAHKQLPEAGTQLLAAVTSPAVIMQAASLELAGEVIDAARELSGKALETANPKLQADKAA